jgi:tRNA pseudouridine55 synthase
MKQTPNRLFVVDKPVNRSSNGYMGYIKRKYRTKKVGFSGTLDPFASGCLIVATGQYTKLFRYLAKTPKVYRATLWLGADSPTLDLEQVTSITETAPLDEETIRRTLKAFEGEITYYPPKYSAKKTDGRRAYEWMREGKDPALKPITSTIHAIELLRYNHPFVHFEATVSEGTYIRSLGALIADRLGIDGVLSSLRRIREGDFVYDDERPIDPFAHLRIARNVYTGDPEWLEQGKRLSLRYFADQSDGEYLVETERYFAIIAIENGEVSYRLNRLEKFHPN